MRKLVIVVASLALLAPAVTAPAFAQHGGAPEYLEDEEYVGEADGKDNYERDLGPYPEDYDHSGEQADGDYADEERQTWHGDDGRLYCRRADGTTGTIIGGGAGALIGRGFDTRGERGTGTILGAIVGALLGNAIERSARCR